VRKGLANGGIGSLENSRSNFKKTGFADERLVCSLGMLSCSDSVWKMALQRVHRTLVPEQKMEAARLERWFAGKGVNL